MATVLAAIITSQSPPIVNLISSLLGSDRTLEAESPDKLTQPSVTSKPSNQEQLLEPKVSKELGIPPVADEKADVESTNSSKASALTQAEALELVNDWLKAKSRILASPFDIEQLEDLAHTDGSLYTRVTSPETGIPFLKDSGSFYSYQPFSIEFWGFDSDDESPTLKVKVSEKLYIL